MTSNPDNRRNHSPTVGGLLRLGLIGLLLTQASWGGAAGAAGPVTSRREPPVPMTTLEIVDDSDVGLLAAQLLVESVTGTVLGSSPGVLLVRVPIAQRSLVESEVHGYVREPLVVDVVTGSIGDHPQFGPTGGAEVTITNADAWHTAGYTGSGVKIGVIDYFDISLYWNEAEHGPTPVDGVTARCFSYGYDCTYEFYDGVDTGSEYHGEAVIEIIRDMAPAAQIFIGQAATVSDYYALISWFAENGVMVINRSLGSRYDGPGDGRGSLDEVAAYAISQGMGWINAAGNSGTGSYYRHAVRIVNGSVAFGASGVSTFLRLNGCVVLGGVRWANDWDVPAAQRTDYDVYLWEAPKGSPNSGVVVDFSVEDQRLGGAPPIEHLDARCPTVSTNALYLKIVLDGGASAGDVIEILDYGDGFAAHTQAAYSASIPVVDSTDAGVIAVGSVSPTDSTIAGYSSQGPTNDNRLAPEVTAPGAVVSWDNSTFEGTSAAAPVVTGAAALLIEAGLAADPRSLGNLIRNLTVDRGVPGPDNVFGTGEIRLPEPPLVGIDSTPSRFVAAAAPTRILDTRPDNPIGPTELIGPLWAGEMRDLPVLGVAGVPLSGVTAVAVNITIVNPPERGYVQAVPTNRAALGLFSNLNVAKGQTTPNFAIVPVGDGGKVSLYSIGRGNLIVDLLGWFESTSGAVSAGRFVELPTPQRVLDTRTAKPISALRSGTTRNVEPPTGVDPAQISALVVTVTGTRASTRGWVQIFPRNRIDAIGRTSTLNLDPGRTSANTAIVPVSTSGLAITGNFTSSGTAHVIVDVVGYITSAAAPLSTSGRYVPVAPNRAFDSRWPGFGALTDAQNAVVNASDAPGVTVPDSATAVVWNIVAIQAARGGYAKAWASDQSEPATSALNWSVAGETRATATIVAVDAGRSTFKVDDGGVNVAGALCGFLADVFGYFT